MFESIAFCRLNGKGMRKKYYPPEQAHVDGVDKGLRTSDKMGNFRGTIFSSTFSSMALRMSSGFMGHFVDPAAK
jgi:hypothetical protein